MIKFWGGKNLTVFLIDPKLKDQSEISNWFEFTLPSCERTLNESILFGDDKSI